MPLKTHLDDEPTLNLTAMLDIMFLLIIFFMLGTRFVDDERKIGLRVPEVVDRGALTPAPARRTVNVYRDGAITLDQDASDASRVGRQIDVRAAAIQRSRRVGPRRRGRQVSANRRRAERLQASRHPKSRHRRPPGASKHELK